MGIYAFTDNANILESRQMTFKVLFLFRERVNINLDDMTLEVHKLVFIHEFQPIYPHFFYGDANKNKIPQGYKRCKLRPKTSECIYIYLSCVIIFCACTHVDIHLVNVCINVLDLFSFLECLVQQHNDWVNKMVVQIKLVWSCLVSK